LAGYPAAPAPTRSRPIGVTILAVLTILLGVIIVIAGIILLIASALILGFGFPLAFGLSATVIGGVVFVLGVIWIAVGVGLLHLRGWAWWLAIIVMVLSIVGSIATPVAAIIPGLILVYLILVRHHFR
jgi:lysylphosphatidylglycerol synthetase-like protein (DUF2156 family)